MCVFHSAIVVTGRLQRAISTTHSKWPYYHFIIWTYYPAEGRSNQGERGTNWRSDKRSYAYSCEVLRGSPQPRIVRSGYSCGLPKAADAHQKLRDLLEGWRPLEKCLSSAALEVIQPVLETHGIDQGDVGKEFWPFLSLVALTFVHVLSFAFSFFLFLLFFCFCSSIWFASR